LVGGLGGGLLNSFTFRFADDGSYVYIPGVMTVRNCTVVDNVSELGGGGIYSTANSVATIQNSIAVGNGVVDYFSENQEITPEDITGGVGAASGFNIVGAGDLVNGKNGNRVGVTLSQMHLGPLTDNGGTTQTMALLPGSVAIDAGSNARAVGLDGKPLVTDQRLRARFANGRVDVGAFEAAAVAKFYLIDAATGRRLLEIKSGTTVQLSALDGVKTFSIEAVTSPGVVGSVKFRLDGRSYTENLPPYGVFGTRGAIFLPGPLAVGQHDLSATPFDRIFGLGAAGTSLAARFTIVA
jgi:hypothetical protein